MNDNSSTLRNKLDKTQNFTYQTQKAFYKKRNYDSIKYVKTSFNMGVKTSNVLAINIITNIVYQIVA